MGRLKKMPAAPGYSVPALEKGLDVLEALAADSVPQSLAGLAARLKRSSSELFRILNCLERRGYVTRDAVSAKYGVSLKPFALAHGHSVVGKLVQASRGPMQALTESVRESCHLSVLERGRLLVIAQEESPERVRLSVEVGGVFDPVATSSGRLLMAYLDEAERARIAAESPAHRRLGPGARRSLQTALRQIRRTGLSAAESETVEGVRDLAVLVGRPEAGVTAALAVTQLMRWTPHADDAALRSSVTSTARDITAALGLSK
jgi:DNA-binding IclR family transcriptional regulator